MNDTDPVRRDPIIATRGEVPNDAGAGSDHRASYRDDSKPDAAPERVQSGGGWKLLSVISLLGLLGVGGFTWRQSVAQAELLARFDELSAKISSTDESLNQSGAAISIKLKEQSGALDKQAGEIKKLWALANETQRKALADNKASIDGLKSRIDSHDKTLKELDQTGVALKNKLDTELKKLESASSAALAASAAVDDMTARVKVIGDRLNGLDKSLREAQANLAARVKDNEQAIRAIDSFRREINQQLQDIRQRQTSPTPTVQ
ncbi:MAG: hypothetical protein ACSLE5_01525 [Porticoccaceae bacterium]